MEAGDHHGFAHSIRIQAVKLAIEQGSPAKVDQALGPVVDHVAEARALACRKDDRLIHLAPLPFKCGGDWALALSSPDKGLSA